MSTTFANLFRQFRTGLLLLVVATIGLGLLYPVAVYAVGRAVPDRADGQIVSVDGVNGGAPVGSAIIGQSFTEPQWFWPRP